MLAESHAHPAGTLHWRHASAVHESGAVVTQRHWVPACAGTTEYLLCPVAGVKGGEWMPCVMTVACRFNGSSALYLHHGPKEPPSSPRKRGPSAFMLAVSRAHPAGTLHWRHASAVHESGAVVTQRHWVPAFAGTTEYLLCPVAGVKGGEWMPCVMTVACRFNGSGALYLHHGLKEPPSSPRKRGPSAFMLAVSHAHPAGTLHWRHASAVH